MPDYGLDAYVQQQEQERLRQMEETRQLQERLARESTYTSQPQQSGGGNGGSQANFGNFMGGMSGSVDPSKMQSMFGGGASGASGGGSSAAGGGGSGGWGLGSMFGGGGTAGAGGTAAGTSGGSSAAGGAASSGSSGMAAGGMWAALAAVIIANEDNARKGGYRDENKGDYAKDLLGGKVIEQDFNQRWLPKIYGKDLENDKTGIGHEQKAFGELMSGDFKNAGKALENGTIGKLAKGIKKLF